MLTSEAQVPRCGSAWKNGSDFTFDGEEAYWQPDNAFFDLLRDKAAVNAMLRHIGGKVVADANVTATAKVQKKIVRDFIAGDGRKKAEGWLPCYMEFPFKSYTKGGAGRLSDNTARVKPLIA